MTDISTIIARSLSGQATDREQAELKRWLGESPEHEQMYRSLLKRKDLTGQYRVYDSVDEEQAWQRFKADNGVREIRPLVVRLIRYAAVAVVALCLIVPLSKYVLHDSPEPDAAVLTAMQRSEQAGRQKAVLVMADGERTVLLNPRDISRESIVEKLFRNIITGSDTARSTLSTYPDTEYWITLEDGTMVHLNGGTRLTYPEHFGSDSREVSIDGEAYFEVAHISGKPFRVSTPHGEITDYGTAFNVNTRTKGGTEVALVKGRVGIKSGSASEMMLKPGDVAVFDGTTRRASVEKTDVSPFVAWNKGNFTFTDCPLETLMDVISHWYGIKVRYEGGGFGSIRFTGDIDRYESVRPVLHAIQTANPELQIEQNGREFVLRMK